MAAILYVSAFLAGGWANYSATHRTEAVPAGIYQERLACRKTELREETKQGPWPNTRA